MNSPRYELGSRRGPTSRSLSHLHLPDLTPQISACSFVSSGKSEREAEYAHECCSLIETSQIEVECVFHLLVVLPLFRGSGRLVSHPHLLRLRTQGILGWLTAWSGGGPERGLRFLTRLILSGLSDWTLDTISAWKLRQKQDNSQEYWEVAARRHHWVDSSKKCLDLMTKEISSCARCSHWDNWFVADQGLTATRPFICLRGLLLWIAIELTSADESMNM